MRWYGREFMVVVGTGVMLAAAGCGGGSATTAGSASGTPAASAKPSTASPKPMAGVPAGVTVPLVHKQRLTVCENPTGMPYLGETSQSSLTGNGKVSGFDVDVLSLVGQRLGVKPLFMKVDPQKIFTGSADLSKTCDLVAAGFPQDPFFAKWYDLTHSYLRRDFAILVKKGSTYTSLASLAGKRVGVYGTGGPGGDPKIDYVSYLKQYNSKHGNRIQVVQQREKSQVLSMLQGGRVDAIVSDSGTALYNAKKDPRLRVAAQIGAGYARTFGVPKGNKALVKQINAALADAADNGQYAHAYATWFGGRPSWLPTR